MLQELGDVEEEGEHCDWEEVLQQPTPLALSVSHHGVVVVRPGHGDEPLQCHPDRHQDGARHGDVAQGVEELGDQKLVVAGVHLRTCSTQSQWKEADIRSVLYQRSL